MSYYAMQADECDLRAQRAADPRLRALVESERQVWLELEAQSRMLELVASSIRRSQGEDHSLRGGS